MDLPVCLLDGFNPLCLDVFLDFNLFSCWVLEDGTTTVDIVHFFKFGSIAMTTTAHAQ